MTDLDTAAIRAALDENARLRARLAEVKAERDHYRQTANFATKNVGDWQEMESRLAEVEAERDELATGYATQMSAISDLLRRIRAVEEVCDAASGDHIGGVTVVRVPLVRAAAAPNSAPNEDDRPAEGWTSTRVTDVWDKLTPDDRRLLGKFLTAVAEEQLPAANEVAAAIDAAVPATPPAPTEGCPVCDLAADCGVTVHGCKHGDDPAAGEAPPTETLTGGTE